MATQFIKHGDKTYAVAFSIRDLFGLCAKKNMTLEELMASFDGPLDAEAYDTALDLACSALNVGARRCGDDVRFTAEQLDEMFSEDISLFKKIVSALVASIAKSEVFPKAAKAKSKAKEGR